MLASLRLSKDPTRTLVYSFELHTRNLTKQAKYEVRPIEKSEELEGTSRLLHLYVQGERYKSHD